MSSEENQIKAQHGVNAKKNLSYVVRELEDYGALQGHQDNPTFGYEGHDSDQFKADKIVTRFDGSQCVLYSTNSIRSDRVKGQQWDAYNIKQIDENIEYAYIVIPSDESLDNGGKLQEKIRNGELHSAIDDIMTTSEYYEQEISRYGDSLKDGIRHDWEGRKFEDLFATILSSQENLNRFNGEGNDVGYLYDIFYKTIKALQFEPKEIKSITADTNIPRLPTGGNAKTDVAAFILLETGNQQLITFSLKDSSNKSVSVHEYTADAFADVLDANNNRLRELLNEFQRAHNARDMAEGTAEELKKELRPYRLALDKWVFSGMGAEGITPIQCAQYLVTKSKGSNNVEIHDIDSYCRTQEQLNKGNSGFGTIFQWTYPSKKAGKSIQLKARI